MSISITEKVEANAELWLVKSGDCVTGPFTTEELANKIRSKEVVVIDEVSAPQSRWRYVRDEPAFSAVVEEIRRGLLHAREDTEVQGYTSSETPAQTFTDSDPFRTDVREAKPLNEDSVPTITASNGMIAEADYQDSLTPVRRRNTSKPFVTDRQYGLESPAKEPSKRSTLRLVGWGAAALLCAGVAYKALQSPRGVSTIIVTDSKISDLLKQGAAAWDKGDFVEALRLYSEANRMQPAEPEIAARLAALMMRIEGRTAEAKRLLQEAEGRLQTPEQKKSNAEGRASIDLGLGLAALYSEDVAEAETRLSRARQSGDWIAAFNYGVAAHMSQSWANAIERFHSAGSAAGNEPIALFMLAKSLVASSAAPKSLARRQADDAVEQLIVKGEDFQQEAFVIGAYMDAMSGNRKRAAMRVRAALDVDPQQTADYFHDPRLHLEEASWSRLVSMCRVINNDLKSATSRALYTICLVKAGQTDEAGRFIETELVRAPSEAHLQTANAYLLATTGRDDDARAALKVATKTQSPKLADYLEARLCEKSKDSVCAQEAWAPLASAEPPSAAALTGLAAVRLQEGRSAEASSLLAKAAAISPRYVPMMRLQAHAGLEMSPRRESAASKSVSRSGPDSQDAVSPKAANRKGSKQ